MAEIAQPMRFKLDIRAGLVTQPQRSILRQGDAYANRVIAALYDGAQEYDLDGVTVYGAFMRPMDNARIDLEGEANGNEASVLLDEQCYALSGSYTLDVILEAGVARRTVLSITGDVERRNNGEIVIAGTVANVDAQLAELRALKEELTQLGAELEAKGEALEEIGEAQVAAVEAAGEKELAAIKAVGADQLIADLNAAGAAQQTAIENKAANALASIPEDYTTLSETVSSLKDHKADAIIDTDARAASHELHAQRGPMSVTLFGKTVETGSGDKSPDNPYTISGVDAAQVRAGGKNLINPEALIDGFLYTVPSQGIAPASATEQEKTTEYIPVAEGIDYTLSATVQSGKIAWVGLVFYDADKNGLANRTATTGTANTARRTDKAPAGARYIRCSFRTFGNATAQLEIGSTATSYEPYIANVINPSLLPDGSPLHGNGTVDDTIENDVASGYDMAITFDGSENWSFGPWSTGASRAFINDLDVAAVSWDAVKTNLFPVNISPTGTGGACFHSSVLTQFDVMLLDTDWSALGISDVDTWKAYLAVNPLTIYYKSADYTPDKDLRVARVVRNWKAFTLTGDETYYTASAGNGQFVEITTGGRFDLGAANLVTRGGKVTHGNLAAIVAGGTAIGFNGYGKSIYARLTGYDTAETLKAYAAEQYATGTPIEITYQLSTTETYMTDKYVLRKPDDMTDAATTTVTGSGETAVEYPHTTKHYIDSQIAAAVALALGN